VRAAPLQKSAKRRGQIRPGACAAARTCRGQLYRCVSNHAAWQRAATPGKAAKNGPRGDAKPSEDHEEEPAVCAYARMRASCVRVERHRFKSCAEYLTVGLHSVCQSKSVAVEARRVGEYRPLLHAGFSGTPGEGKSRLADGQDWDCEVHFFHAGACSGAALVVLERPWLEIVADLPAPLLRPRFAT
jgi:hypothetical protein